MDDAQKKTYGKLISNELGVEKVHAQGVCHEQNGILGAAVFGIGKVCADL